MLKERPTANPNRPARPGDALPTAVVIADHRGAYRSLRREGVPAVMVDDVTPERSPYPEGAFRQCPTYVAGGGNPDWVNWMCELALSFREETPVLFSATDWGLHAVAEHYESLGRLYRMATPPPEVIRILLSKVEFADWANGRRIPIPASRVFRRRESVDLRRVDIPLPWVIKPSLTFRMVDAKGLKLFRAETREQAGEFIGVCHEHGMDVVVQEDISQGNSVLWSFSGVCCPAGKIHSAVLAVKMRQSKGGVATAVETLPMDSGILEIAERVCAELRYPGIFEMELCADRAGKPAVIEINPRIWNQAELPAAADKNLVYYAYRAAAEGDISDLLPKGFDYRPHVGWVNFRRDWKVSAKMLLRKQVSLPELLRSYRRARAFEKL